MGNSIVYYLGISAPHAWAKMQVNALESYHVALFPSKPKPKTAPAPTQRPDAAKPAQVKNASATIQVSEVGLSLPPWVEEAVIHYATGKTGEATAALNRHVLDHPKDRDMTPWLMLFDILEANDDQEHFEDLALDFAVKFERSPPVWAPTLNNSVKAPGDTLKFQFGQTFSAVDKARLQHFLLEASGAACVCLDVSQAPAPSPPYAHSLIDSIQRLRKMAKPIEVIGAPGFIVRLNSACSSDHSDESLWLLLLAMEELQGDPNGFESTALAYAIRFEISPPSYVAPTARPEAAEPSDTDEVSPDTFRFDGMIGSKSARDFQLLESFAAGRAHVEVDMSRVMRIDFASTGQMLDALIRLGERGCKVTLKGCNTLVLALLRMIGADQYATLIQRKRT